MHEFNAGCVKQKDAMRERKMKCDTLYSIKNNLTKTKINKANITQETNIILMNLNFGDPHFFFMSHDFMIEVNIIEKLN